MPSPWFISLLITASLPASSLAAAAGFRVSAIHLPPTAQALPTRSAAVHDSRYDAMPRASAATNCAATEAPEALATPGPLLQTAGSGARFTVSFIVGTDGRVHSPLILQGSDSDEDRAVLSAVQSWKYRPARCNGVPMEAEGRIEFLSH